MSAGLAELDLSRVGAGFGNEALGSQAVFRTALQAMAHPGRCMLVTHDAQVPHGVHRASAALMLALLDADCRVWLSPALQGEAAAWLRFHTGCHWAAQPGQAQFAWVASGDAVPALAQWAQGSDERPETSTTCVIDVAALGDEALASQGHGGQHWQLTGPGIREVQGLQVQGLPDDFAAQWAHNHAAFPGGVDLFLVHGDRLAALPRTTRLQPQAATSAGG